MTVTGLKQAKIDRLRRLLEEALDLLDRIGPEVDEAQASRYVLTRDHLRDAIRELDQELSGRPRE